MPRLPRLHVVGGCYHVILRGNHRENIFDCAEDRGVLNGIVAESIEKYGARIHAFCWMTNHLHTLVQIAEQPLGKLIQKIAIGYSRYRHKQLRTTGHLFERRHRAWLVDVDTYFIALLRYIHLNPVQAGLARTPRDYPWSSHRAYLGLESLPWLTTEFGLGLFGKTLDAARDAYRSFMSGETQTSNAGSDLLPSIDPRVIGTDRFLASLPPPRRSPRSTLSLPELAIAVCRRHNLPIEIVISPSRERWLSSARVEIAQTAIAQRIASLHEVARFFGRSPSSVFALIQRRSRP